MMMPELAISMDELARLEAMLQRHLRGKIHGLRLEWRGKGVALLGKAGSYYAKQLAQAYLMDIAEINIAANEIRVIQTDPAHSLQNVS